MRRRKGTIAAVLSSVWLTGCATSALDMAPERPDRPWVPATTASGEVIAGQPQAPPTAEGYVLPANPTLGKVPSPPTVEGAKVYSLSELIDLAEIEQSGDADCLERGAASRARRRDRRERLPPGYYGNRHRRIPGQQRSSNGARNGL